MSSEQQRDAAIAEAAGYIAGAVASAYAGPAAGALAGEVVEAIAGALLSADDDRYQKEIIGRLASIELKVDQILRFLNVQLRDYMLDALGENEIRNIIVSLHSDLIDLKVAVAMLKVASPRTSADGDRVVDAANKVLGSGYRLFVRNPGRFVVAVPYVAHAFASLSFCRTVVPLRYDQPLQVWGAAYRDDIAPWLLESVPGATTFPQALRITINDYEDAKAVMADFQDGPGTTVRYVVGVAQIGQYASLALCADFTLNADHTISSNYIGGIGNAFPVYLESGSNLNDLAAAAGAKEHPTIRPFFGPAAGISNATEYWRYYSDAFVSRIFRSAGVCATAPDRIEALEFVIRTLDPFVEGLSLLAAPKSADTVLAEAMLAQEQLAA